MKGDFTIGTLLWWPNQIPNRYRLRFRLALWLLRLPKDTAGLLTPGTITFPPGTSVRIEGFHLLPSDEGGGPCHALYLDDGRIDMFTRRAGAS